MTQAVQNRFFLSQKLRATGDYPRRHDGLSIFFFVESRVNPGRCKSAFFLSQKLHATGTIRVDTPFLSVFLLYRVWSQSGRNLALR
jgi:hypothetical protein